MHSRPNARSLRWLADTAEQAQRVRLQTGERIRAVVQGRDEAWFAPPVEVDANELLKRIRKGETDGPVPLLGRTYRRHWEEEQEMLREMRDALEAHPAWGWLQGVKGVGPGLAGKLLARLDATKAETPSAFWAYCGLATVPGTAYECEVCGLRAAFPESFRISGAHQALGSTRPCSGALVRVADPGREVRVAQPKPGRGVQASYDRTAKKLCYLVGTSFLKAGGPYEELYRRERVKLDRDRPGWAAARKHLTALRKTEKLFLSHLWLIWREAVGLPTTEPYAQAQQDHTGWIDPWEMVSSEALGGAVAAASA